MQSKIASLMFGVAFVMLILGNIFNNLVVQPYTHRNDDWLLLMLPLGGGLGLVLGLRYQHKAWLHVVSVVIGFCSVIALFDIWQAVKQTKGFGRIGGLFLAVMLLILAITAVVCFCIAALANEIGSWQRRRSVADRANAADTGRSTTHEVRGPSDTPSV